MTKPGFEPGPPLWEAGDYIFFLILDCEAIGTAATPGPLCQPRVIVKMIVDKQMECRLAGETTVLGKNLPQRHFCPSQNPTWPDPGLNPGHRVGKPATNRLSYDAVKIFSFKKSCSYIYTTPPYELYWVSSSALLVTGIFSIQTYFALSPYCVIFFMNIL
jgi:hypothetical protein